MISFKDARRKLVLPTWFDFGGAAKRGELAWPRKKQFNLNDRDQARFETAIVEFKAFPTGHVASDLFGFALSIGREDIAREAAHTLIQIGGIQPVARELAQRYLLQAERGVMLDWKEQVRTIRKLLSSNPRNPIAWVERARAYTVLGQWKQAEHALDMALRLAPDNRYVLRSLARFYIHIDAPEVAWKIFRRTGSVESDPWLKSCEINLAVLAEKAPKRIPREDLGEVLQGDAFFYSELLESVGMVHLLNGKDKHARKVFEMAWKAASHNVVTHGEWVTRHHFPALEEKISGKFNESLEALTFSSYFAEDIDAAARSAADWTFEEPYSTKPVSMAAYLASLRGEYAVSEQFARRGLDSNPEDVGLRNNLVFALLKKGSVEEAERQQPCLPPQGIRNQICYIATQGLLNFKKGNAEVGRCLYAEAIGLAEKEKHLRLLSMARLNLALAELESGGVDAARAVTEIVGQVSEDKNPDVRFLRKRVETGMENLFAIGAGEKPPTELSLSSSERNLAQAPAGIGGKLLSLFRRKD